jgi:hypothetical protein
MYDEDDGKWLTTQTALEYLQGIYRNPSEPEGRRLKAAMAALPFESPRLSAVANIDPLQFAEKLERAILRSGVRLIEAKAEDGR